MVILKGGKSHEVAVCLLHAMRLKIHDSHLTCKVANKFLNVCKRVEVVERNEDGLLTFPAVL